MTKLLIAWIATAVAFAALDLTWLTAMSARFYRPVIGELMSGKVEPAPAVLFYLLYISGLVFFAVWPAVKAGDYGRALLQGVVLGVLAYGTYDLTNQATLRVWSWKLTIVDVVWGGVASSVAALAGTWAARLVAR
jgi:uncharacterized membrane protein